MTEYITFTPPVANIIPGERQDVVVNIPTGSEGSILSSITPEQQQLVQAGQSLPVGGTLTINGNSNDKIGIDNGIIAFNQLYVNNLGTSSFVEARLNPLTVNGASPTNQVKLFADNISQASPYVGMDASIKNTLAILNPTVETSSSVIYDRGGNDIWAGSSKVTLTLANSNDQSSDSTSRVYASDSSGFFDIRGDKGTHNHVNLILDIVDYVEANANPAYTVSTDENGTSNISQRSGSLQYEGYNATIVLNGYNSHTSANLTLRGNDTVLSGDGNTNATIRSGNNTITLSGNGELNIHGDTGGYGGSVVVNGVDNTNGTTTYTQELENFTASSLSGYLSATLGQGKADINVAPLQNGYSITTGLGNEIIRGFTTSAGIDLSITNRHIYLGSGQSITGSDFSGGNSTYSLSSGNNITFLGVDLQGQNPFS
ncbi:autotransporter outer membrane beta-barrel domain-containing protein [Entomobacter blattae]|uniref:Uncharacterized protein n=1 Tax=Entomobacter blattae TaxID=2762277 RepID=A0A7H1NTW2_9PROT|nr:hypothetical protein [Entomobacter blattae]QNT79222.1 hypothetical protein JGUZn3_20170 [Entomobacter blattae]